MMNAEDDWTRQRATAFNEAFFHTVVNATPEGTGRMMNLVDDAIKTGASCSEWRAAFKRLAAEELRRSPDRQE
ncbi:MAG: hypothetical protein HQL73_12940 [Magnetococcales bacterium]|nr:hypothetical protein [Magnetococcales bacterium]